ncbi:hypothetical protein [Paenibacillus sp. FSL L8-0708]|uniref:hypothetical protein n=1 Tax=Paenibacillus sp. FSL L8-0708 TaxID=2975311 RepID=UPI0030FCE432
MEEDEEKKLADVADKKKKSAKKRRITAEEKRLRESYKKIPDDLMRVADGLIRRAAYMRVTLEDYEIDLDNGGYVEQFTQSEKTKAYERERPVARLYNQMNRNFQQIIKQLTDMLPKPDPEKDSPKDDGFEAFVINR